MNRRSILVGIGSTALLVVAGIAQAADPALTTISVKGMQCAACASHVSESLQAIPGVAKAQADATKAVAVVTAKANTNPSPKALWEAVEKAGYTPLKIVGPNGTFTSKPKS
jgi:copper chaperone CopZ